MIVATSVQFIQVIDTKLILNSIKVGDVSGVSLLYTQCQELSKSTEGHG